MAFKIRKLISQQILSNLWVIPKKKTCPAQKKLGKDRNLSWERKDGRAHFLGFHEATWLSFREKRHSEITQQWTWGVVRTGYLWVLRKRNDVRTEMWGVVFLKGRKFVPLKCRWRKGVKIVARIGPSFPIFRREAVHICSQYTVVLVRIIRRATWLPWNNI